MKEIIFGIVYAIIGLVITYDILIKEKDKHKFIKKLFSIVLLILIGLYLPIHINETIRINKIQRLSNDD